MSFVVIAILFSKLWFASIIFGRVRIYTLLTKGNIQRGIEKSQLVEKTVEMYKKEKHHNGWKVGVWMVETKPTRY